jgi:hypothetical protein
MSAARNGGNESRGAGSVPSQRACCSIAMMPDTRSWIAPSGPRGDETEQPPSAIDIRPNGLYGYIPRPVCRQAFKMAPSINVTDPTFARLQKFAKPLIDTPESVIIRLMDAFEKRQSVSPPNGAKEYGVGAAPNLTHTKVLSIELNGAECPKSETNWNRLLDDVINQAAKKLKDVTALKELLVVNHVIGKKEDQGYRYLATAGISVQGQDANSAWKAVAHIIKSMNFSCRVIFMWYDNDKAAHPGQTGKFTLNLV